MKRFLSLLIAVVMIATTLPLSASSTGMRTHEQQELLDLACEVFPEYSYLIRGDQISSNSESRTSSTNDVLFTKTRYISENKSLTITLLSGSDVVVTTGEISWCDFSGSSSNIWTDSSGIRGYASYEITSTEAFGTFSLRNIQFQIMFHSNDYFTNYGTASYSSGIALGTVTNTPTQISYNITFNAYGAAKRPFTFTVYFANNQVVGNINA